MSSYEDFIEDYRWFKSFGMPDVRIAQRMGLSEADFGRLCQRAGVRQTDPALVESLEALIASGNEFDAIDFPMWILPKDIGPALALALRRGLIIRVRHRKDPLHDGHRIAVYRATAVADQVTRVA